MIKPSRIALHIKIGNYFTLFEGDEMGIYQVRRDNVKALQRAHYVGSLDSKVEAEELIKRLNNREMNTEQLHEYLEKREDEKIESNAIVGDLWGYPSTHF